MELRHLVTFRSVVTTGSFTRAALALGYAQSSVTAHIQAIEAELGIPLFDRVARQVTLTDAGRRFSGYANRLLALADEARAATANPEAAEGLLTISAPETLCTYRVPLLLRALRERYPGVRVIFRPGESTQLRQRVRDRAIDFGMVMEPPHATAGLVVEALAQEPILVIAASTHPLASSPHVTAADIVGEPLLLTEVGCAYRMRFEEALTMAGVVPNDVLEFNSVEAIKQCVAAGMGLAVLPEIACAREVRQGSLVALPWADTDLTMVTQMFWHAERWMSPALRAIIELARETIAN
jgi:DNA-binding transcriptional LysR family regulator